MWMWDFDWKYVHRRNVYRYFRMFNALVLSFHTKNCYCTVYSRNCNTHSQTHTRIKHESFEKNIRKIRETKKAFIEYEFSKSESTSMLDAAQCVAILHFRIFSKSIQLHKMHQNSSIRPLSITRDELLWPANGYIEFVIPIDIFPLHIDSQGTHCVLIFFHEMNANFRKRH